MKWDYEKALQLQVGDTVRWRHTKYNTSNSNYDEQKLVKEVCVKAITKTTIKTTFGTYEMKTGRNTFEPCGCMKFCDCYGKLELL